MNSLERRFVVGLATTLVIVFGFLFWGAMAAVKSLSEANVLARLEHDAEALLAALWVNPAGQVKLREGRITPIYQQPLSGHYFLLSFDTRPPLRSLSLWDETLQVPPLAAGAVRAFQAAGPQGQYLQYRSAGYEKSGLHFTLTVAEDLTPMLAHIHRFQVFALGLLTFALLVIVLLQRYVLRRGFRALDRVREEVSGVASGQLQRLQALGPVEIRPLTTEINRLLTQLQQRLQRSRQSLGNLAHALKGPLSLMTRDVDGLALPATERQRLVDRMDRIRTLIERELKRARFAGEGGGQRFLPQRDVPELVEALGQIHRDRQIDIQLAPLPEGGLPFDHEDMLELLGNLLDNAYKWARGRVRLHLEVQVNTLCITVADDGPGVSEADRAGLLHRGTRLDEQESGHGLGLAIVNDLVSDQGGSLDLQRSVELGGLEVQVMLPLNMRGE